MCAYDPDTTACDDDAGGPLTLTANDRAYVVGVISYGPKVCGSTSDPTVLTRIGPVAEWIVKRIQDGECANHDLNQDKIKEERQKALQKLKENLG